MQDPASSRTQSPETTPPDSVRLPRFDQNTWPDFLCAALAMAAYVLWIYCFRYRGLLAEDDLYRMLVGLLDGARYGTASAFAAVVVFANYINGQNVVALYHKPSLLWLIVPLMILWLCRVWLLASRGELNEDPVVFALTDRMSLMIGAAVALIALLAI